MQTRASIPLRVSWLDWLRVWFLMPLFALSETEAGTVVRSESDQKAELEATSLQPSDPLEAALVATIPPGQYTAQVRGKPETTGIGVVQVYFLQ